MPPPDNTTGNGAAQAGDDPRKVLFSMMPPQPTKITDEDNRDSITALQNASPHMTVEDKSHLPSGASVEDNMINSIRERVLKYGTLKEVMIYGHGDSERQYVGAQDGISGSTDMLLERKSRTSGGREDASVDIHTDSFLEKLKALQKELHVKITDRVVFEGCNVFTNLPPEKVDYYRKTAQELGTEIVGTTNTENIPGGGLMGSVFGAKPTVMARFEQFTPDGKVVRDKLGQYPDTIFGKTMAHIADAVSAMTFADDSWATCHENKTQAEGAKCQEDLKNRVNFDYMNVDPLGFPVYQWQPVEHHPVSAPPAPAKPQQPEAQQPDRSRR